MARRVLLGTMGFLLLAAACSNSSEGPAPLPAEDVPTLAPAATGAPTTTAAPTTTTLPGIDSSATNPAPALENRLVIIDAAGDVVTIDPDGTGGIILAEASQQDSTFFQPIWSPTALELAWSHANPGGSSLDISDADGSSLRSTPMASAPFYMYWAPDGSRIGVLHATNDAGIELEIVDSDGDQDTVTATGAPFYFSWRPDATSMVAHIGGGGLVTIDGAGERVVVGPTSPEYQAPYWTTSGIMHLDSGELRLIDSSGTSVSIASMPGPATFVASPDGKRVAIQATAAASDGLVIALQSAPDLPADVVVVLDVTTGSVETVTGGTAIGFFWSPDSEKLLIMRPSETRGHVDISVWQSGQSQLLVSYAPDISFVLGVLQFFNQYAQSYQPWSPDSAEFAVAGSINEVHGIWVQPADGSVPRMIADGSWVAWSPS